MHELSESVQGFLEKNKPAGEKSFESTDLSSIERQVLSQLSQEEKHIDVIIENSRLSPAEVSATLVQLELNGLIRQLEGKLFVVL